MVDIARISSIRIAVCASLVGAFGCSTEVSQPDVTTADQALADERNDSVPLGSFFEVDEAPRAFGDLIRSEATEAYDLAPGAEATRIIYRSRDALGRDTTASAVIVVPNGEAPAEGWPLVVWAHGTTGVARQCGPSATKMLGYYSTDLMNDDFALLVVDYAGLSTEGPPHQYMAKSSNALDIESAVPAARAAVSSLGKKWLAIGHSQGGAAVWGLAEHKHDRPDENYLGSIALAPAIGGADLIGNNANLPRETFYPLYWAYAVKVHSPEFDVETMLTENAMRFYKAAVTDGCWDYGFALSADLVPGTVLREGWKEQPAVAQFLSSIHTGDSPIAGPLFVAAGKEDIGVRQEYIETGVNAQCESGGEVLFRAYPGSHDGMMETSFEDQMNWIRERFDGIAAKSNCER